MLCSVWAVLNGCKWHTRHFREEKRKSGARRGACGGNVLTCSSFGKFTWKSIPNNSLNSVSIRAKLISSSRKSPSATWSSPATVQLFSGCPAPLLKGQQYQFSSQKHPPNLSRTAVPHHQTVASLVFPQAAPSTQIFSSQEITWASPSCPASLKLSKSAQIFGKGEGSQSVCGNGAWPQTASQLHPSCESEQSPRSPGQKPPQEGQRSCHSSLASNVQTPRTSLSHCAPLVEHNTSSDHRI